MTGSAKATRRYAIGAVLLLLLLADTTYSFLQHYHQPLDGDVAWNLVPAAEVRPILADPFGVTPWLNGKTYPNPNRFFCHWSYRTYFLHFPGRLQAFVDPVSSVYLAAAIAKTLVQLLLVALLARIVTGPGGVRSFRLLAVSVLLIPFFQANGYRSHLGIIDPSITYTFFYALPAALLLLFLIPFADRLFHGRHGKISWPIASSLIFLAVIVCLSGPLNPGAVLVLTAVTGAGLLAAGWGRGRDVFAGSQKRLWMLGAFIAVLAAYSLWVGSYNSLTVENQISLLDLYSRLPEGLYRQFTQKLAWPLLLAMLLGNYFILARLVPAKRSSIRKVYAFVGAFTLLYLLLLPLGGYRDYRFYVIRYDTILPVTLALLVLYVATVCRIFSALRGRWRNSYSVVIFLVAANFTLADGWDTEQQECEARALREIVSSPLDTVEVSANCQVLSWITFGNAAESELNARLLVRWGITPERKLYYNRVD